MLDNAIFTPLYVCMADARKLYPDVFPPPPPQMTLPFKTPRTRKVLGHSYVPLDASVDA